MLSQLRILSFMVSVATVLAVPTMKQRRQSISPVSASVQSSITPYANFASAAYCTSGSSTTWKCGVTCAANPDFISYAGGGDDDDTPYWFVGWSPSLKTIIVTHEGTDPTQLLSDLDDAQVLQVQMPQSYFPGISSSIYVHSGFLYTFETTATAILSAVRTVSSKYKSTTVTVVGHSLGGALANLDGVYLKLQMPSLTVKIITFGEPRVGNPAWANYLNSFSITRITHDLDPIPIVPGRALGYEQPDGEIHIDGSGVWNACAGEDNTNTECSTGAVPNIIESDLIDHLGPYNGVWMGTIYC